MMDDELLNRARALMSAMNAMSTEQSVAIERATRDMTLLDQHNQNHNHNPHYHEHNQSQSHHPSMIKSPKKQKAKASSQLLLDTTPSSQFPPSTISENSTEFRGAAINGSSILTTFHDLRPFITRGSALLVDNVPYQIALQGEFTSNRIELAVDYSGPTNLNASLSTSQAKKPAKALTRKANSPQPIAAGTLLNAVEGLKDIAKLVGTTSNEDVEGGISPRSKKDSGKASKIPKKKSSKPKPSTFPNINSEPSASNYLPEPTSARETNNRSPRFANETSSHYDNLNGGSSAITTAVSGIDNPYAIMNLGTIQSENEQRQQRKLLVLEMRAKRKAEEQELRRKAAAEALAKEKQHEASAIKVAMLRDKTAQRVQKLKEDKLQREAEEAERKQAEEAERREREAQQHSDEAQEKLKLMKAATLARMRRRNAELRQKEQEEAEMKLQVLKQVAKEKGRLVPTGVLLGLPPVKKDPTLGNSSMVDVGWQVEGQSAREYDVDTAYGNAPDNSSASNTRVSVSEGKAVGTRPREKMSASHSNVSAAVALPPIQSKGAPAAAPIASGVNVQVHNRQNESMRDDDDGVLFANFSDGYGAGAPYLAPKGNSSRSSPIKAKTTVGNVPKRDDDDDDDWSDDSIGDTAVVSDKSSKKQQVQKGGVLLPALNGNPPQMPTKPPLRPTIQKGPPDSSTYRGRNAIVDGSIDDVSVLSDFSHDTRSQQPSYAPSQQHGGASAMSKPSIATSKSKSSQIWRKLKPLSVAPFQPVPALL